jgi:hypothetical protein
MGGKTTSKATVLRYMGSTRSKIFGLADGKPTVRTKYRSNRARVVNKGAGVVDSYQILATETTAPENG